MQGFNFVFDTNEAMSNRNPPYNAQRMAERPHEKIIAPIRLNNLRGVPGEEMINLTTSLWVNHNMELTPSKSSPADTVIISGIPPNFGFGPQQVVEIVRRLIGEWSDAELVEELN